MPQQYDLLVFDWDGTLMDSTGLIVEAIQYAFRHAGLPVPSDERASHIIGLGLGDALRYLYPPLTPDDELQIVEAYRHHYLARDNAVLLFDGVQAALGRYREAGFVLAVATGKARRGLERALDVSGLAGLFDITRCADETFSKPHPAMLEEIMAFTGVPAGRTLMIGDTTHDLQMAINARTAGFGVAYGAHPLAALEALNPVGVALTFTELDLWLSTNA